MSPKQKEAAKSAAHGAAPATPLGRAPQPSFCDHCGEAHGPDVRCARCADCDEECLPDDRPGRLSLCDQCRDERSGPPIRDDERALEWDRTEQAWVVS